MPRTLNPLVEGSSPSRPTNEIKGIGPLGTDYRPTGVDEGAGTEEWFYRHLLVIAGVSPVPPVPTGANQAGQLDLFPEIRHPGL